MSQVPRILESMKARGERSSLQPFSYDAGSKLFRIGDQDIVLTRFDPYTYDSYDFGVDFDGIEVDEITDHAALLPAFGAIIVGPKLHSWFNNNPGEIGVVVEVMRDAYTELDGTFDESPDVEDGLGHLSFTAGPREYGGFRLQVEGSCACLSAEEGRHWIEGTFEVDFAEYGLHNADSQPQRAALYAGMGHLARLAS